jgi:hypothetical protein
VSSSASSGSKATACAWGRGRGLSDSIRNESRKRLQGLAQLGRGLLRVKQELATTRCLQIDNALRSRAIANGLCERRYPGKLHMQAQSSDQSDAVSPVEEV